MNNMGDPQKLNDLNNMYKQLYNAISECEKQGMKLAQVDRDYKVKRKLAMLNRKAEGMAVGLIDKVTAGDTADAKMSVDIEQTKYDMAQEHIRALKLEIQSLDAQIKREWGSL